MQPLRPTAPGQVSTLPHVYYRDGLSCFGEARRVFWIHGADDARAANTAANAAVIIKHLRLPGSSHPLRDVMPRVKSPLPLCFLFPRPETAALGVPESAALALQMLLLGLRSFVLRPELEREDIMVANAHVAAWFSPLTAFVCVQPPCRGRELQVLVRTSWQRLRPLLDAPPEMLGGLDDCFVAFSTGSIPARDAIAFVRSLVSTRIARAPAATAAIAPCDVETERDAAGRAIAHIVSTGQGRVALLLPILQRSPCSVAGCTHRVGAAWVANGRLGFLPQTMGQCQQDRAATLLEPRTSLAQVCRPTLLSMKGEGAMWLDKRGAVCAVVCDGIVLQDGSGRFVTPPASEAGAQEYAALWTRLFS